MSALFKYKDPFSRFGLKKKTKKKTNKQECIFTKFNSTNSCCLIILKMDLLIIIPGELIRLILGIGFGLHVYLTG